MNDKRRLSIDIPNSEYQKIQLEALKQNISPKKYLENLVTEHTKQKKNVYALKTE